MTAAAARAPRAGYEAAAAAAAAGRGRGGAAEDHEARSRPRSEAAAAASSGSGGRGAEGEGRRSGRGQAGGASAPAAAQLRPARPEHPASRRMWTPGGGAGGPEGGCGGSQRRGSGDPGPGEGGQATPPAPKRRRVREGAGCVASGAWLHARVGRAGDRSDPPAVIRCETGREEDFRFWGCTWRRSGRFLRLW